MLTKPTEERKRFKPRSILKLLESVLVYIDIGAGKDNYEAQDQCLRHNGQLMTLPQSREEEDVMDKVMWDFYAKAWNITYFIEVWVIQAVWVAALGTLPDISPGANNEDQFYPPGGEIPLIHPLTKEPMKVYRKDIRWPQMDTTYSPKRHCSQCFNSLKYPQPGNFLNDRTEILCQQLPCLGKSQGHLICMFSKEPTFKVRGLCKDSVMDTQYKFADPERSNGAQTPRGYVGPKGWMISRNVTDNRWRMTHYYYTHLTLTMLDQDVFPIGKHKWRAENNVCTEGRTSSIVLQFSGCKEGEFTCDDGKCLDITQRCNNIEVSQLRVHILQIHLLSMK